MATIRGGKGQGQDFPSGGEPWPLFLPPVEGGTNTQSGEKKWRGRFVQIGEKMVEAGLGETKKLGPWLSKCGAFGCGGFGVNSGGLSSLPRFLSKPPSSSISRAVCKLTPTTTTTTRG